MDRQIKLKGHEMVEVISPNGLFKIKIGFNTINNNMFILEDSYGVYDASRYYKICPQCKKGNLE